MARTVFFSWQSDLRETRDVIRAALDRAVTSLSRDVVLEDALRVDEATAGVPGWPEITSTILHKIERCEVFVADVTPINGPSSSFRLTPNPNVLFELGYALATGLGRTRIICVVNASYLPDGDPKELPFDLRGSRPLRFTLEDPEARGVAKGQEDRVRAEARGNLARGFERSLTQTLDAIQVQRESRLLEVTAHLATDKLERFQVVFDAANPVPFQVDYLVKEPSGTVLSGIMMSPTRVDPTDDRRIRFPPVTLKSRTPGNDIYVLSGKIAHIPSDERPVPKFYPFEVQYRAVGPLLREIDRNQPPPH